MKIKSILIANRGEIAIRIMQTAKKMGIKTYAIKTASEPKAMYLQFADELCDFSGNFEEVPDFLNIDKIIKTAKDLCIDAIHPGYGFLAENPYFAQRCEDEGILFIGPSPDAIYKMGNKTIARQIAINNNIPLLKGSKGNVNTVDKALKTADTIGYPVILKAAAGGGGRGMRIVESPEKMDKMFQMATLEAEKAFNDPSVFLEKYVSNPRHIEFQIMADKYGNTIHLGERECSIQRKHQKLIEEAPSVALNDELRKEMGDIAVKIAKAVNYYSAGTVEFLVDDRNNYYFMEMNTRIQVEHPVTELVTGIDLVELQINIAQGDALSYKQSDIKLNGWAIECRINAEDVQSGFSPSLGTIEIFIAPVNKQVRVDTGVQNGSEVTASYDSMLAKLIAHGQDRHQAISNALTAANKIKIKGIKTTLPFCKAVFKNKAFREGNINTSFISTLDKLYFEEPEGEMLAAFLAAYHQAMEVKREKETYVDYDRGKNLTPWLLNKRSKSL